MQHIYCACALLTRSRLAYIAYWNKQDAWLGTDTQVDVNELCWRYINLPLLCMHRLIMITMHVVLLGHAFYLDLYLYKLEKFRWLIACKMVSYYISHCKHSIRGDKVWVSNNICARWWSNTNTCLFVAKCDFHANLQLTCINTKFA